MSVHQMIFRIVMKMTSSHLQILWKSCIWDFYAVFFFKHFCIEQAKTILFLLRTSYNFECSFSPFLLDFDILLDFYAVVFKDLFIVTPFSLIHQRMCQVFCSYKLSGEAFSFKNHKSYQFTQTFLFQSTLSRDISLCINSDVLYSNYSILRSQDQVSCLSSQSPRFSHKNDF